MGVRSLLNGDTQYFVIDKDTRVITPPTSFKNFGVESDENSNRVYFQCPRYVGDNLDLTTLSVRVNYQNANSEIDQYIVTDVTADGENVSFSWVLSRKATAYKGTISFIVCAVKTDSDGVITNEWNTTLTSGAVLSGLEVESPVATEDVTDVVNQLLTIVNGAVTDMETAASEGLANIKTAESQAIAAINSTPNSLFANAIKGNARGAVVRVDDVSPVEHTVSVKAKSKNVARAVRTSSLPSSSYCLWHSGEVLPNTTYTLSFVGAAGHKFFANQHLFTVFEKGECDGTRQTLVLTTRPNVSATNTRQYESGKGWKILGNSSGNTVFVNFTDVQMEIGNVATEYTPYIDPATATVNRCAKNLLKNIATTHATTGLDFTVREDGTIAVNGTATATTYMKVGTVNLKAGKTYTLSGCPAGGNASTYRLDLRNSNTSLYEPFVYDYGEGAVFTPGNDVTLSVGLRYFIDTVIENKIFSPMVELADYVTEYEPYNGATYTPDAAGNVNAVSIAPTMTLFTDTEGVNVECEYTKDTNAVIQSLIDRLVELESN